MTIWYYCVIHCVLMCDCYSLLFLYCDVLFWYIVLSFILLVLFQYCVVIVILFIVWYSMLYLLLKWLMSMSVTVIVLLCHYSVMFTVTFDILWPGFLLHLMLYIVHFMMPLVTLLHFFQCCVPVVPFIFCIPVVFCILVTVMYIITNCPVIDHSLLIQYSHCYSWCCCLVLLFWYIVDGSDHWSVFIDVLIDDIHCCYSHSDVWYIYWCYWMTIYLFLALLIFVLIWLWHLYSFLLFYCLLTVVDWLYYSVWLIVPTLSLCDIDVLLVMSIVNCAFYCW